jgi:soluble lytic murein transglycosylase
MTLLLSIFLVCVSCINEDDTAAAILQDGRAYRATLQTTSAPQALLLTEAQSDDALAAVRGLDRAGRTSDGRVAQLPPAEHARRATTYMTNRAFAEAREHWQAIIERYPNDLFVPVALFGMGRSYSQARGYAESLPFFERLVSAYPQTKEGREGLYALASALLRMSRSDEAAARYREYTERYPQGERIESAYLNVIDSLREAGKSQEAINWIARTRTKFPNTPTATNAHFARLRLDIAAKDWQHAIETADDLRRMSFPRNVATNSEEVAYLRAYSLERAGRKDEAISAYLAITDRADSYHGAMATERLQAIVDAARRPQVQARMSSAKAQIESSASDYPALFREIIVREARSRKVDPRLVLAIMRQESGFRARAKSPAAARGLLQLIMEAANKYGPRAGLTNVREDDLYRPDINIRIATEYLAELYKLFPGLPDAVAASYNGGEDNVARWLKRSAHHDPAIFASEVGFSETKGYVFKVMANYRAYRQLYTENLIRK